MEQDVAINQMLQTQNWIAFIAEIIQVLIRRVREEMDYGPDVVITGYKLALTAAVWFYFVLFSFIGAARSSVCSRHARVTAAIPIKPR